MSSPLTRWQEEIDSLKKKYSVLRPLTPQQANLCSDEEKRQYAFALYQLENRRFRKPYRFCFEMDLRIFLGEVDKRIEPRKYGKHADLEDILKRHSSKWDAYYFNKSYEEQAR